MITKNPLFETTSFSELLPIIQHLEPKLSFLGERYVTVSNDVIQIDAVADHMINCLKRNPHFSEDDRPHVKEIPKGINRLYEISDRQVQQSNFFTRTIIWLRKQMNMIFGHLSPRWWWKGCEISNQPSYSNMFRCYTSIQFQQRFKCTPEEVRPKNSLLHYEGSDEIERWEVLRYASNIQQLN